MNNFNDQIKQLNKIKNGKGIQHILDRTYAIMGNPVLVFDMEYKLIAAAAGAVNDDPIWCEFMTHGKLTDTTIEFFKNESFIDSVANCTQFDGVTYLFSDKLKYDRFFGQLYNKEQLAVADMVMVACERPFKMDTPKLIKTVCNILSEELSKNNYYQIYGQVYQDNIMKLLIEATIADKGIYSGHVSNIEKGLKSHIFLAVIDIAQTKQTNHTNMEPKHFIDLFKQAQPNCKYSVYNDYIVMLISSDRTKLSIKKDLNNLNELFEKENIHAGISSCFENLFELQKYYFEAMDALNDEKKAGCCRKITFFTV